jgi:hypothetical protein
MKIREFIDQFMQGEPLTMTLRDPAGHEFVADHVLVGAVSGHVNGCSIKENLWALELVLTGPELET